MSIMRSYGTRSLSARYRRAGHKPQPQSSVSLKKMTDTSVIERHRNPVRCLHKNDTASEGRISMYWRGELPKDFEYNDDLGALYSEMTGIAVKIAARTWGPPTSFHHRLNVVRRTG